MTGNDKLLHLKRDFQAFKHAHSWYKHLAIRGEPFYATYDINHLTWWFYNCESYTACDKVYIFEVGAFLRGSETDATEDGYVQGVTALVDDYYDDFMEVINERYPQWSNLDWPELSLTPSDPIVVQLFRAESQRYYDQLLQQVLNG